MALANHRRSDLLRAAVGGEQHMVWAVLNEDAIPAIRELLESQSDRVVAVVGASLADEHVRRALEWRLRAKTEKKDKILERMFGPNGPLGGFANRTDLAYLLYAIGKPLHLALRGIAKIRNVFAHELAISSFDNPDAQLAKGFRMLKLHEGRAHYPSPSWRGDTTDALDPVSTRREAFKVNLRIALALLDRDMSSHLPYTNTAAPMPGPPPGEPPAPFPSQ
jgi:hypothetical protein